MGGTPQIEKNQERINIINISPVLSTFLENVLKTGEMLIMLIMLIPLFFKKWLNGEPLQVKNPPKRINIINISPVLATFSKNVLKTGEMLIMLILFWPPTPPQTPHSSPGINMINIINISRVLSTFLETLELTWLTLLTFPLF